MFNNFFAAILGAVSEARLKPYGKDNDPETIILAKYLRNTALSESLYPALNGLEVSLRNSLHHAITEFRGDEYWFDSIPVGNGLQQLLDVKQRLAANKKDANAGQVVASLDFGFWTQLFNSSYEDKGKLWPHLLEAVFPHAPKQQRTRKVLSKKLNKFRHLRNRISHYEPVWHWGDLANTHQGILDVTGWISPEMLSLVELIDRFPEIHSRGVLSYENLILQSLTPR